MEPYPYPYQLLHCSSFDTTHGEHLIFRFCVRYHRNGQFTLLDVSSAANILEMHEPL